MADLAPNSAIVLTPPGSAAIAVIRLRGPAVGEFLAAHFSRPVEAGRCIHGQFVEGGWVLDDPVVVLSPDGTWADISVHGSTWIVSRLMEVAAAAGFVAEDVKAARADSPLAEAALDDDSVLQREVYAHLPCARTRQAVRLLLAQPAQWRKLCERPAEADIAAVLRNRGLWWHLRQPRVAIVGPPNAGKSTLANALFGRERSITADLPGTTRDWVGAVADLDGLAVMLIDTPGQRTRDNPTEDAIEQAAIELSRGEIARSDLTILVLDGSRELMPQQRPLIADYPGAICVRNKADLPCAWSTAELTSLDCLPTTSTTGQGLPELARRIRRFFGCHPAVIGPCWWTPRQREILQRALVDRRALSEI